MYCSPESRSLCNELKSSDFFRDTRVVTSVTPGLRNNERYFCGTLFSNAREVRRDSCYFINLAIQTKGEYFWGVRKVAFKATIDNLFEAVSLWKTEQIPRLLSRKMKLLFKTQEVIDLALALEPLDPRLLVMVAPSRMALQKATVALRVKHRKKTISRLRILSELFHRIRSSVGLGLLPSASTAQTTESKENRSDATQSLSFLYSNRNSGNIGSSSEYYSECVKVNFRFLYLYITLQFLRCHLL